MLSIEGKTSRLVIVDLDNTLWGGVIGDDGLHGIKLNNDYPGNIYKDIQLFLKALTVRGIVLAVCSKNTEEVVLSAFKEHEDMVLKLEDFASLRINWGDKSANIRSICQELSLGTYSVLFIDDNPVERELVKRNIPDCTVADLPANVSEWVNFLSAHPHLQVHRVTKEDFKRNAQYSQKAKVEQIKATFDNLDDFFVSMSMRIFIEPYSPINRTRVEQLIVKTNQFNTTTKRYDRQDLERLLNKGAKIFAVHYQDKMFEKEIIGVLIIKPHKNFQEYILDSFVLSCRVLGRNIETALLSWLLAWAAKAGALTVVGEFNATDKNKPVQNLFPSHGFEPMPKGNYIYHLKRSKPIMIPKYIDLEERVEVA
jgi:FkbH-like protein